MQEYAASRTGPLTSPSVDTYAYLSVLDCASKEEQVSLRELSASSRPPPGASLGQVRACAYHQVAEKAFLENDATAAYLSILGQHVLPVDPASDSPPGPSPGKFLAIALILAQPLSRGSVHIASTDASAAPVVDPSYLSHPVDLGIMAQHMRFIDTLAASTPMSKLIKQPLRRRDPASYLADAAAAKRFLQTSAVTMWHLAGTCAMLPRGKGGVVDTEMKVYWVQRLRVVDSSAIPLISTASLHATVYAFAEKAAALINEEHGLM